MFRIRRLSMRWAVLLVGVLAAGALAQSAVASTLASETFAANSTTPGHMVTAACGPPYTYHVEGDAVGPHTGTFVEDGVVVADPATGFLVSLDATFTIISPSGNVTGEKHFVGTPSPNNAAFCDPLTGGRGQAFSGELCYRAQFADGSSETGRASLLVSHGLDLFDFFSEGFVPDATVSCGACPDEEDEDGDGLIDSQESRFFTLLGNDDSDFDGIADGNDDANGNGEDDEDEDDDEDDGCPDEDSDDDGEDDEDEDDEEDDDDD